MVQSLMAVSPQRIVVVSPTRRSKMKNNGIELEVLVNGIALPEYLHEGNFYVEGREGYEFEVKIKNNTFKRILVVPSIDGRSVMDGNLASPESSGYVIRPYSEYKITGWRRNLESAAKFVFSTVSYGQRMGDSGVNNGVIGVLVYDEIVKPTYRNNSVYGRLTAKSASPYMNCSYNSGEAVRGIVPGADGTTTATTGEFSLGTDYGREVSDRVSTTSFDRGAMLADLRMFYAPLESLVAWGIDMAKPHTPPTLPQPFVGVGCPAPAGWTGAKSAYR